MRTWLATLERRATALALILWLLAGPAALAAREAFASCGMPCCRTEKECCCRRAARESKGSYWKKAAGCAGKCRLSLTGIRVAAASEPAPGGALRVAAATRSAPVIEQRGFLSRPGATRVRGRAPPFVS
jgi:hypothetical protein